MTRTRRYNLKIAKRTELKIRTSETSLLSGDKTPPSDKDISSYRPRKGKKTVQPKKK